MRLIAFRPEGSAGRPGSPALLRDVLPWVDSLHLRGPMDESADDLRQLIEALPDDQRGKLWLHDHFELAAEYGLGGIHLSRRALEKHKALGVYAGIHGLGASVSCHDLAAAGSLDALHDRVFVCPLYDSISKPGHRGGFDQAALVQFLGTRREAEFIALGGVTLAHAAAVRELGFDGLAVLGALWSADDPLEYIQQLHDRCHRELNTY